eukprot:gene27346-36110_t
MQFGSRLKYKLGERIGGGSFGEIFEVRNLKTGEDCAAKEEIIKVPIRRHSTFEGKSKEISQQDGEDYEGNELEELGQNETKFIPSHLRRECKIYNKLAGEVGIPKVRWFGMVPGNSNIGRQDSNIMVMDLLGNSLEDLFNYCKRKFSLKTVLVLAFELVCRIETIQVKGYLIHRDIKPENFLVGKGRERHTVYIIDFGLAKYFKNPRTGKHIPKKDGNSLTGTARYASINSHMGKEQSRRDDLMSVGYVLMYFLRGQLPWQGLKAETNNEKYKLILEKKMTTTTEELCNGFPDLFLRLNYTYDNILFDWEILAYQRAAAAAN